MKKILFFALFFIVMFAHTSLALNVGVAPPVTDFGVVKPGSQLSGTFYIMSDGSVDFKANLISVRAPDDFYYPGRPRIRYTFNASAASEEDPSKWITFLENPVMVPTDAYFVPEINTWVNKKVDFILTIPEDAEPGYHAGQIVPSPEISPSAGGGVGVGIITVVKATYVFRVLGNAVRRAEIMGFDYNRINDKYEEIKVLVKNTGTVTTSIKLDEIEIDEGGKKVKLSGTRKKIKPNQIAEFSSRYDVSGKELGSYKATARVSWLTGKTEKSGIIEITKYNKPPITGKTVQPTPTIPIQYPLWVAPTLIIFFAIIYWWYNEKS